MKRCFLPVLAIVLCCVAGWPAWASSAPSSSAAAAASNPVLLSADTVYLIPIEGPIGKTLLYVLRRGLAEAERLPAKGIIFVLNTPGGQLDATEEIVQMLLKIKVPTCALIKSRALSAGAIIAMATDQIYMTPGSVIGDALPIMITPFGGVQEMPEALQEKAVSAVAAIIRAAAQQKGHDPQLAEAMVRREMEYKVGEETISPAGRLLTLTDGEAARKVGKEQRPLLSTGTVADVPELLQKLGWQDARQVTLQVTATEKVAGFIESLSVILLVVGLLGLYIEFKTPGFGLPGIVGIVCLAIFFWGHHIAGLAGMWEVVLFLIGAVFLLVEIFLIPGFGVVGVTGILLMLAAVVSAMAPLWPRPNLPTFAVNQWQWAAFKTAVAVTALGLMMWVVGKYLPKSRLLRWVALEATSDRRQGYASTADHRMLVGQIGVATTALRPAGIGSFGDTRLDVVTRGEFIEAGAKIKIVEAQGLRIVVEAA